MHPLKDRFLLLQNASNLLKELVVHEAAELSSKQEASKSQYLVHHRYLYTCWKQFAMLVWYMNPSVGIMIPFSTSSAVSLNAMVYFILHVGDVFANMTLLYISAVHYIIFIVIILNFTLYYLWFILFD